MAYIWLSHQLTHDTPLYGGAHNLKLIKNKSIENGDTCNTSELYFSSHAGTHVDAPLHFIQNGKCIEDYAPGDWVFTNIQVAYFKAAPAQIIQPRDIHIDENPDTEIILLRSSFEKFRGENLYWEKNPGLAPELADFLMVICPKLKMIGMDFISISSYAHRDTGREAHQTFLNKGLRLIEDMHLSTLKKEARLFQMFVMPVRFLNAEGSPCTILGVVE